jgi:hypothetical protein
VRDELAFGPLNMGLAQESVEARVADTLAMLEIEELADRCQVFGEDHTILAEGRPGDVLGDRELLLAANLVHDHPHLHASDVPHHRHVHDAGHHHAPPG